MNEEAEWLHYLERWDRLVDGLRGRVSGEEVEEIRYEGIQEPFYGISGVLGAHEQGMWDLTPAEEEELWELASLMDCRDEDLLNPDQRAASVRNRPIRTVRPKHPLRGGGHGARTGQPGKRAFPARWSDDDAIAHTMDVARQPSSAVKLPSGEFLARGERDGVTLAVVVSPAGDVLTSYPVDGPGVEQHPADELRAEAAQRLQSLLAAVVPADHERRPHLDELHAVGEWPYVLSSVLVLDLPMNEEQRAELTELCRLADLPDSAA